MDILNTVITGLLTPFFIIGGLFTPAPEPNLGVALPSATAVFETSLASSITSTATSMTLTANSVRGGGSLSGFECFTIDEGSAQAETVCGTVSGTSVTDMTRGVSQADGVTEVSALQFSHRRGANVKITDFPILQRLRNQNNGEATFENPLVYADGVGTSTVGAAGQNLASVAYANSLSFGAIPEASEAAAGFVELATATETASSTSEGSTGARLAITASNATSTYNAATADLKVVVTQNNGKIDENFLPTTLNNEYTFATTTNFTATSTVSIGSFPAYNIGKNIAVLTSTGTSTFAVPEGITKLKVQAIGGGGTGGDSSDQESGGGGGAGGYAMGFVDVTATSTIQTYVGAASQRTTFGTIGDEFINCTSGNAGVNKTGGSGGSCTGGDLNVTGGTGQAGYSSGSPLSGSVGGAGFFGNTGAYGSGGGGASSDGAGGSSGSGGGSGTQGVIIIEW